MLKITTSGKLLAAAALCCGMLVAGCGSTATESAVIWGQVDATEVDINTKVAGRLMELYVKEGSVVKRGQLLARIDAREKQAKTAAAKAQLEASRAAAVQAANLANARQDMLRYDSLYRQGAASEQSCDAYQTKYKVAAAAYEQEQQGVTAAEENLRQSGIYLEETNIIAPFDGIIVNKYVDPGAMISTGMPIVALQDPLDNWADFKVKETELEHYAVGAPAEVRGRSEKLRLQGKIVDISRKPDFASYRATSERGDAGDIIAFNVKVQLNDERVRPGMRFCLVKAADGERRP